MSDQDVLQRISDELEIRNLVIKAAVYSDTIPDLDEFLTKYVPIFSEDCRWIFHPVHGQPDTPPYNGHADIIAGAKDRRSRHITGPGTHCFHHILNTLVTLNGDEAAATSYMHFVCKCDTTPQGFAYRVYRDRFRRTPQGWKLTLRELCPG